MDSEHFALLDRHGRHIPRLLRPRPRWFSPKHRTESQRGIFDANQTHHSTNLDAFPTAAFRTDVLATVTSFEVPSSQHVVRIAMHDLDGAMLPPSVPRRPVPPAIFDANVIYGMFSASPYDILRRHSRLDEDRLNRMYSALRLLGSPLLLNSSFEAMDQTWTARGFLVAFPSDAPDLAMVEHRVVVLARTMEQAHVWKWTSHVWGTSATRHRNAIQEVVPTFAQLESLHAKRPCYDISWRDEAA
ncbi:hypothetical protein, variant 3 [Aphanomyces invadans]|uniref:Uncharacterized protein n=1 Tax=Aphanomyces invadans TaxID=157072 RepID=A0A024US88_9STRA|nr:hypothetical protein, variant 2 [Aphanomyces invadans]XP_008863167.1 hypothetical protein, variant 3 [Aphanomyces invadans]ETW09355.1 hypothetical protein, variant 2 [Aphanomyces invadans]ETW09356.1 hypothetical protein, variant 3 [Aphanomyces invadans]|eukprot:XP_008863166.1 hypothetical protein, variant 2 [Aphanomyces invadans]